MIRRTGLKSRSRTLFSVGRKAPKIQQNVMVASTTQVAADRPVSNEFPHPQVMQHEEEHRLATKLGTEGDKPNTADAKDVEQTVKESEEIQKLRRDLSQSRSQVAELQRRCEAQSRDLQGSNDFLNTADKSSDSDVIRACQKLNAELQQNTTYMTDCFVGDFEFQNGTTNPTKEQTAAVNRILDHIGPILAKSLEANTPEDLPMLLQTALQAHLASILSLAASSWALEPGYNAFIFGIYQRLRSVGED